VRDLDNRRVEYTYVNGLPASVRDVRGETMSYEFDVAVTRARFSVAFVLPNQSQ